MTKADVIDILVDLQSEIEETVLADNPNTLLTFLQARESCVAVIQQKIYKLKEEEKSKRLNNCWCNTCEYKHLESECLGCAEYDEHDNLINLRNYKKEEGK